MLYTCAVEGLRCYKCIYNKLVAGRSSKRIMSKDDCLAPHLPEADVWNVTCSPGYHCGIVSGLITANIPLGMYEDIHCSNNFAEYLYKHGQNI